MLSCKAETSASSSGKGRVLAFNREERSTSVGLESSEESGNSCFSTASTHVHLSHVSRS